MEDDRIILKIFLIGFHHRFGPSIEIQYPETETIGDNDVASLSLPEQSHNFTSDTSYFIIPSKENKSPLFGVSCFRQIALDKLTNRSENDEFSRSSVQKSVCCLSRLPLFGYLEVKISIIVDQIFEKANFTCKESLNQTIIEFYNELNRCLTLRNPRNDSEFISENSNDYYIETCLRELIGLWKHKILVFFKLFLLEKKILFFGTPVKPVCQCIISIISLHPELLNSGLCNAEQKFKVKDDTQTNDTTSRNVKTPEKSPDLDNLDEFDSKKQITILPTIPSSEYLAPLQIFKNGYLCLPFISLSHIDFITDKLHNGFVIGASNVLFRQKKMDVLIDVNAMTFDCDDFELKKCLALTTEDLRFFDHLSKGIENPRKDGYGTDSWIREQFESYFTSMLKTAYLNENARDCECFNADFIFAWRKTNNFQDWLARKITSTSNDSQPNAFDHFPPGHPFSRQSLAIVSDFKNKISQSINNTQSGRKAQQVVNNTFTNARSTFSTWLSNFSQKEESTESAATNETCEKVVD